ncbi:MAG: hypothetical protein WBN51_08990 [Gammaproteobacteria bacterium]
MKQGVLLIVLATLLSGVIYYVTQTAPDQQLKDASPADRPVARQPAPEDVTPQKAVLDISVHTLDELRVVLDRAEQLALRPQSQDDAASVVLVLHGPEVEFFSIRNYDKYKDIVDQAARLDAFDVVDVKICRTMLGMQGIESDDVPSFIDQVTFGPDEVERLVQQGYIYF